MAEPKRTRLFFLGFPESGVARPALDQVEGGVKEKEITVSDWAMIQKPAEGGEARITTNKSADPGAVRGARVGGLAGAAVAVLSGPIGVGAVVGGAAIGAVAAALKDSGLKDRDLESISRLMAAGREGLVFAVPLDDADRFQSFMDRTVEFAATDRNLHVDIVPGRTLQDAIAHYIEHEDD